nr:uncharacterized protein LOC121126187 isoform X2 [Lepeophtheirus salmonis]
MILLYLIISNVIIGAVHGLECYVCKDQDGNTAKCLKTIRTCEQEQDRCLSTIRWGSFPYWNEGAEKQYYVSKRCATKDECDGEIRDLMPLCHYLWYEDWKCAECCQGDRCNYYVTLGARSTYSPCVSLLAVMLLLYLSAWF